MILGVEILRVGMTMVKMQGFRGIYKPNTLGGNWMVSFQIEDIEIWSSDEPDSEESDDSGFRFE